MGANYRGPQIDFVDDAMYKLPYELIGNMIDKKDKEAEEALTNSSALSDLLSIQNLASDDEDAKKILSGYETEIESLTADINNNIVNAGAYSPKIEALKRKLAKDKREGDWSKIENNKALFDTWYKEEKTRAEKLGKEVSPHQLELLVQERLNKFGKTIQGNGNYSTFSGDSILGTKEVTDVMDDIFSKKVGKVKKVEWDRETGRYRVEGERATEGWTKDDLKNDYEAYLKANPDYLMGVKQKADLGVQGYSSGQLFDENGSIILDPNDPKKRNYFSDSLDLAYQTYGITNTLKSDSKELSYQGKKDLDQEMEEKKNEMPGVSFSLVDDNIITHDYKTYESKLTSATEQKNSIIKNTLSQLNIDPNSEEGKKKIFALQKGHYSAIPEGTDGREQIINNLRDATANENLAKGVKKDFESYLAKLPTEIVLTPRNSSNKAVGKPFKANKNTAEGRAAIFNSMYSRQKGYNKTVSDNLIASNVDASGRTIIKPGLANKITEALNSNLGKVVIGLEETEFTNDKGEKVRLVPRNSKVIPKSGVKDIPILNSNKQVLINDLKKNGISVNLLTPNKDTEGNEVPNESKYDNTKFNGGVRLVDRDVNGKAQFLVGIQIGNNHKANVTTPAEQIIHSDVQEFVNDPVRKEKSRLANRIKNFTPNMEARDVNINGKNVKLLRKNGSYYYVIGENEKSIGLYPGGLNEAQASEFYAKSLEKN